jgi:hypothetical protein
MDIHAWQRGREPEAHALLAHTPRHRPPPGSAPRPPGQPLRPSAAASVGWWRFVSFSGGRPPCRRWGGSRRRGRQPQVRGAFLLPQAVELIQRLRRSQMRVRDSQPRWTCHQRRLRHQHQLQRQRRSQRDARRRRPLRLLPGQFRSTKSRLTCHTSTDRRRSSPGLRIPKGV